MAKKHEKRRTFTKEFKLEAVRLVFDEGVPVSEVARDLDVHQNMIYKWRDDLRQKGGSAFPGRGHAPDQENEINRLKRQLKEVTLERDI